MLHIKRLQIRGFRGYVSERELTFSTPVTILCGGNHCGKSSTLNAIEWCLYGDQCSRSDTGIRERVGWIVHNQYQTGSDVRVALELADGDRTLRIERTLTKVKGKQAKGLHVVLPHGPELVGEAAAEKLAQLVPWSFRDFMSTTYLHQESVRAILTQEPRERNDAIDRLLGLALYRNLLQSVQTARCAKVQKELAETFKGFESRVGEARKIRQRDVDKADKDGVPAKYLNAHGLIQMCSAARNALQGFAEAEAVTCGLPELPTGWQEVQTFRAEMKRAITNLRSAMPGTKRQAQLQGRKLELAGLKSEYESKQQELERVEGEIAKYSQTTGGEEKVLQKIDQNDSLLKEKHAEREAASDRAELIHATINFLKQAPLSGLEGKCPVCKSRAPKLLNRLEEEWRDSLEPAVGKIQKDIDRLREQQEESEALRDGWGNLQKRFTTAREALGTVRSQLSRSLGRELTESDDPVVILKQELDSIDEQLGEISVTLGKRQEHLSTIEAELDKVGLVLRVLEAEQKLNTIQELQESDEYGALEATRDQVAIFVEDVEQVSAAITAVLNEEAREKVQAASAKIQEYFHRIAEHPAFGRIQVQVESRKTTGQNDYRFLDEKGQEVTPVLSQGDYNALAMAIFLGLGAASGQSGGFGFLMLDDPSQSLACDHKERLVKVLDEVSSHRQLIIATMDEELRRLLNQGLTRSKTTYEFAHWTVEDGPVIERK